MRRQQDVRDPAAAAPHPTRPHQAPPAVAVADGPLPRIPPRLEGGTAAIAATRHHSLVHHDEHPRPHLASPDPRPRTRAGGRGSRCCSLNPSLINCKSNDSVTTNPLDDAGEARPRWTTASRNVCDDNTRTTRWAPSSPSTTRSALPVTTRGVAQQPAASTGWSWSVTLPLPGAGGVSASLREYLSARARRLASTRWAVSEGPWPPPQRRRG